jgi:hypothetical protein
VLSIDACHIIYNYRTGHHRYGVLGGIGGDRGPRRAQLEIISGYTGTGTLPMLINL